MSLFMISGPLGQNNTQYHNLCRGCTGVDEPGVNTFINPRSFKASYKNKERLIIKTILIQIKALTVELGIDFCIEI